MLTRILNTEEWLACFDDTFSQLLQLVSSFAGETFYSIPCQNCWTAAQVCEHIIKSNGSIAQALAVKGKTAEREPDQRVLEIKELFLDFTKKFQSPDIVLPVEPEYKKETFIKDLEKQIEQIKELRKTVNLAETVNIPGFGELTKFELLYFIIYHTQRHINQMKNIWNSRNNYQGL